MPKYCNFDQIFTFVGALVAIPFTDLGQIWQETVDPWSTLTRQISSGSVYCATFQGQKPQTDTSLLPNARNSNHVTNVHSVEEISNMRCRQADRQMCINELTTNHKQVYQNTQKHRKYYI